MNEDLGWFILFIILIFIMWFSQRGNIDNDSTPELRGEESIVIQDPGYESFSSPEENTPSMPQTIEEMEASYKDKISISIGEARENDPQKEYIIIKALSDNKEKINITGFFLRNSRGEELEIKQAANLFYSGQVSPKNNIILEPGGEATIITGRSPIGTSFRINTCAGHFAQFQEFSPSLSRNCPDTEDTPGLYTININDDECIDYIESLSRCIMPTDIPLTISHECRLYIRENLNYNGCVNNYKDTENFYSKDWRIYLERDQDFWKEKRETISLFGSSKNLIKQISY